MPTLPRVRRGPSSEAEWRQWRIAVLNDNELVLFDERERESWIVYPPRSNYSHVHRPTPGATVVEHHPWAPLTEPVFHSISAAEGCSEHGIECGAYAAIKAGAEMGWDAFK
jgi:hypothetical protein